MYIAMQRQTEDIDFALAVPPDWAAFAALRQQLISSGKFTAHSRTSHRLRHGEPADTRCS